MCWRAKMRAALLSWTGEQAATHARAISKVRKLGAITLWGRSHDRALALAERLHAELAIPVGAARNAEEAAGWADMICTVSGANEPILKGE